MRCITAITIFVLGTVGSAHAQTSDTDTRAPSHPDAHAFSSPPAVVQTPPVPLVLGVYVAPRDSDDVVPLPPPSAPAYPSLAAYQADLRARLTTLHLRELQLNSLANPRGRRRKIVLGSITAGLGLIALYCSTTAWAFSHDAGSPPAFVERRSLAAVGVSGAILATGLSVTIWGLAYRPYRTELRETGLVRRNTQQELERTLAPARSAYIQLSLQRVGLHVRF